MKSNVLNFLQLVNVKCTPQTCGENQTLLEMFSFTSNQPHFLHLPYNLKLAKSICYIEMNKQMSKEYNPSKVALFELLLDRSRAGEPTPIDFSKFNESALNYSSWKREG